MKKEENTLPTIGSSKKERGAVDHLGYSTTYYNGTPAAAGSSSFMGNVFINRGWNVQNKSQLSIQQHSSEQALMRDLILEKKKL